MTTFLYLVTYTAIARNVGTSELATALAAVPRDLVTEETFGLVSLADVTTTAPPYAVRSMTYTSRVSPPPLAPDPQLGQFLTKLYSTKFSRELSTPVVASPVSTVAAPSTPFAWYRADAGATASAAGVVSRWADLSGHTRDLIQVAAPNDPTLVLDTTIDKQALSFASTQILTSSAPFAFDAYTYMWSARSPIAALAGLFFERGPNATTTDGENVYPSTGAANSLVVRRGGTTHSADATANWGIDGHWHVYESVYTPNPSGAGSVVQDGQTRATVTGLAATPVSASFFLGARSGPALGFTGSMRELMIFPSATSAADRALVRAYMQGQVT